MANDRHFIHILRYSPKNCVVTGDRIRIHYYDDKSDKLSSEHTSPKYILIIRIYK